jgi:hypothetical protein
MANDANMHLPQTLNAMGAGSVRAPYWPTYPKQATQADVISLVRLYSAGLAPADSDNVQGQQAIRQIRFDLPVILCALVGTCSLSDGSGFPAGYAPNDTYEVELRTASGEAITINSRIASTVVGPNAGRPGFLGGGGWVFGAGTVLNVMITPRLPGLAAGVTQRIDVTAQCMEFRQGASYLTSNSGR